MALFDKILDDVLGFNPPQQVTGQVSSLTPNQSGIEQALSSLALGNQGSPGIGEPGRAYPGQWSADVSPLQKQAFGVAGGLPQQFATSGAQANNALQQLLNPQQGINLDAIFGHGRNMLRDESERLASKHAFMNGTSSSGAFAAQLRNAKEFALASEAQAIPAQLQAQSLGLQSQLGGLAGLFQGQNQQSGLAALLAQLGGQQRVITAENMASNRERFDLQDPTRSPATQLGLGLLGQNFAEPFMTTKTPLATQLLGQFAGAAGGAAGSYFGGMA